MIGKAEQRIIEDEIKRLEAAWENAHEKYGITGSASTDRTMHKYDTIKNALENYLYNRQNDATERANLRYLEQLSKLHHYVEDRYREGRIEPQIYVELTRILMK